MKTAIALLILALSPSYAASADNLAPRRWMGALAAQTCFSPVPAGAVGASNLLLDFDPNSGDSGKTGHLFVLGQTIDSSRWYCLGSTAGDPVTARWFPYDGSACPAFFGGSLQSLRDVPLLTSVNPAAYPASRLFVGYGIGALNTASWSEMMTALRYEEVCAGP